MAQLFGAPAAELVAAESKRTRVERCSASSRSSGHARAGRRRHRQQQLRLRARADGAQAVYGASKAAVTHLTPSAAAEGGKQGIRANEIAPALLMSDMVKQYYEGPNAIRLEPVTAKLALDRAGHPEDGAAAVLFLCSDQAGYITGVTLPVDGGFLTAQRGIGMTRRSSARCRPSPTRGYRPLA